MNKIVKHHLKKQIEQNKSVKANALNTDLNFRVPKAKIQELSKEIKTGILTARES